MEVERRPSQGKIAVDEDKDEVRLAGAICQCLP